ncbi:uncharacterized protein TNCV_4887481 [Trichonephila clavipes]|nr:uncharacterized protein TNCV_4887481 [Trichonephila clavipes]
MNFDTVDEMRTKIIRIKTGLSSSKREKRELFFEIFVLLFAALVNLMEVMDGIDDDNTFLLDDELHSDTDTYFSSNYLGYSTQDSCSELSSDEDM